MRQIDALLPDVQKPARYTGGEIGEIIKNPAGKLRFAFCFPDVYEVGMSHLGMKILYHALNLRDEIYCERVFTPWTDMAEAMERENLPLFSLETRTPLDEFDFLGFTLQYELSYSNILWMLQMAGIPMRAAERTESHPIIIAGGPCAFNPEPIADFIDAFLIGDGEETTLQLCDLHMKMKDASKEEFLLRAAREIPGVYVPMFYRAQFENGVFQGLQVIKEDAPQIVHRAVVRDLEAVPFPEKIIVPNTEIIHDRIMLEIARGCTRGCRFCQAGMIYRPRRERSLENLLALAESLVRETGYEELSLSSLSTGDYSRLNELAAALMRRHAKDRVAVALPSLRVDSDLAETLEELSQVRRSSLTFAPEAGTQRLRDVINKGVTDTQLLEQAKAAFEMGYASVKLYFMIGLPTETKEDLDGIVELAGRVAKAFYSVPKEKRNKKGLRISVSASSFVPKPDTPFQWCPQDSYATLVEKQKYLRGQFKAMRSVQFSSHDPQTSVLEAAFARGGRELCAVLESAVKLGCRFDGWSEHFNYEKWLAAFAENDLTPNQCAERTFEKDDSLPWAHIGCGVDMAFLYAEYEKALRAEITPDCSQGCLNCGMNGLLEEGCPCV